MGSERNYQIKALSNQVKQYSTQSPVSNPGPETPKDLNP